MKRKAYIVLALSFLLVIAGTASVLILVQSVNSSPPPLSIYSNGEKIHLFQENNEYIFVVNEDVFKNLKEREIVFSSLVEKTEIKIASIKGRPVLMIDNASLNEVVAKNDAIIVLENCTLKKEKKEVIKMENGGVIWLNLKLNTWGDIENNIRPAPWKKPE